jgi:RNA polymerase sigma-70 factor (ECF subfamily)
MAKQAEIESLARERGSALVGYAFLLTGDLPAAQDAVQDAFVRMLGGVRHGRDPEHLEAYVRQVIRNRVCDGHRRSRFFLGVRPGLVDPGATPSDTVVTEYVDLHRALATLSPRERACVVLRYHEDLSVRDTAQALRLSEGAVKRYLSDARHRLGELLGDEPPDTQDVVLESAGRPGRRSTR